MSISLIKLSLQFSLRFKIPSSDFPSLSKQIIELASDSNEVALSIVQSATMAIADYIVELINKLEHSSYEVILAANGSVIKNDFFRSSLDDALKFHFKKIAGFEEFVPQSLKSMSTLPLFISIQSVPPSFIFK